MTPRTALSARFTRALSSLALLAAGTALWACEGKFRRSCPEGTTQTAGGGDIDVACTSNDALAGTGGSAGMGGSAGRAGDAGGGGAAAGGTGGGSQGAAGGGAGGSAGAAPGPALAENVLAAGGLHTCARTSSAVLCWGQNTYGQLGSTANVGTTTPNATPLQITSGDLAGARHLSLGSNHSCALRDDGRVLCWGLNNAGQLGSPLSNPRPEPAPVESDALVGVRQLEVGSDHGCTLRDDGRVVCWGANNAGEVGSGFGNASPSPLVIENGALFAVRQVALGAEYSCALRDDGRVLCWGSNTFGKLGRPPGAGSGGPVPAPIDSLKLAGTRQLALGVGHSCALRDDGRVLCWGDNRVGQLGSSGQAESNPEPREVGGGSLVRVSQVALGFDHTCALRDDGRVLCWGSNAYGQLGTSTNSGTPNPTSVPVLVDNASLGVVRHLALGHNHTCALRDDGRVLCWGRNDFGQLGSGINLGTATPNPVPTEVQSLPALSPSQRPTSN